MSTADMYLVISVTFGSTKAESWLTFLAKYRHYRVCLTDRRKRPRVCLISSGRVPKIRTSKISLWSCLVASQKYV